MKPTRSVAPVPPEQGQPPTLGARRGLATPGRDLGCLQQLWQRCVGCLPVGRRHRAPPRLEDVGHALDKQAQPLTSVDCLDRLIQERPSLRMTIYTTLWQ